MRRTGLGWVGAGLTLACAMVVGARGLQTAPLRPVITDGPSLFRERGCSHCHTIKGLGGDKGPDLSGVGRRLKKDAIAQQIVEGGGAMPAFGEALPSEEIAALVSYLHHCKDKHTPAFKPATNPAAKVVGEPE